MRTLRVCLTTGVAGTHAQLDFATQPEGDCYRGSLTIMTDDAATTLAHYALAGASLPALLEEALAALASHEWEVIHDPA